jgi:hypothetical protein
MRNTQEHIGPAGSQKRAFRILWLTAAFTLVVKIVLSLAIPITSDEAYFVIWAKHLDFGYYDHPPMIGWALHLLSLFGNGILLVRLPAILTTILIGFGIYFLLKGRDRLKASLIATLFLVSPLNVLYILVSTDTPLIFFSFVSCVFLYKAVELKTPLLYLASGIFLGFSLLSKYFAALLAVSYIIYYFVSKKDKDKTMGFLIMFAAAAGLFLINIYWNYTHCWTNIMFNVFNRNEHESFSIGKSGIFLLTQLYLMTPVILYYLIKHRSSIKGKALSGELELFTVCFTAPMAIFLVLSLKKVIGLHWALAFYPFLYIALYYFLEDREILRTIKFMTVFTMVHLFLIGAALSLPVEYARKHKDYNLIVLGTHPKEIIRELKPYENDFMFATTSYSDSAVISYYSGRYFPVFGNGSVYGRQDDFITDYTKLEGANILILEKRDPGERYDQFFKTVDVRNVLIRGAKFYLVLGYGFKFQEYKNVVLEAVKSKYYNIPRILPKKPCGFLQKYFLPELKPVN